MKGSKPIGEGGAELIGDIDIRVRRERRRCNVE
jgi:hypothetical protein